MSSKPRVLIVEPRAPTRLALRSFLAGQGYDIAETGDAQRALEEIVRVPPAVVLCDLALGPLDGLGMLRQARGAGADAAFILMLEPDAGHAAVAALEAGAESTLPKPVDLRAAALLVERAIQRRQSDAEARLLRDRLRDRFHVSQLIGDSPELQALRALVQRVAGARSHVLIKGEPGTGKDHLALVLHQESPRRVQPFTRLDCSAPSASRQVAALVARAPADWATGEASRAGQPVAITAGTLLLDNVEGLPKPAQIALLGLLREQAEDLRFIAATRADLSARVAAGSFAPDLFTRLSAISVALTPLRFRRGDIPLLAQHFTQRFATIYGRTISGLAPRALALLLQREWRGNVRELQHALERGVAQCEGPTLSAAHLTSTLELCVPDPADPTLEAIERAAILGAMKRYDGSTKQAADALGVSVRKIQYRLRSYRETRRKPRKTR